MIIHVIALTPAEYKLKQQQAFDIGYCWEHDYLQNLHEFTDNFNLYLNTDTYEITEVCDKVIKPIENSVFYNMKGFCIE